MSDRIYEAINQLRNHQTQLDADGVMVGVSREALDMVLDCFDECAEIERLRAVNADLVEVLIQAEDYLDKRADSEDREFCPVPNAEMSLLTEVHQALERAEGLS